MKRGKRRTNLRKALIFSVLLVAFVSASVGCASAVENPLFTYTGDVLPSADGWSIIWYEAYESTAAQIEDGVLHITDSSGGGGSGLSYYRAWPSSPDCINVAEFDVKVVSCSGILSVYIGTNDDDYNMVYNLFTDRIQSRYAITYPDSSKAGFQGEVYYFDTTTQFNTYKAIIDNGTAKLYINGTLVLEQPAGTGTYRTDIPPGLNYSNGVEFGVAGSPTTGEAYFDEVRAYSICSSSSTKAPVLTPIGFIAFVGILSAVAAMSIRRRK